MFSDMKPIRGFQCLTWAWSLWVWDLDSSAPSGAGEEEVRMAPWVRVMEGVRVSVKHHGYQVLLLHKEINSFSEWCANSADPQRTPTGDQPREWWCTNEQGTTSNFKMSTRDVCTNECLKNPDNETSKVNKRTNKQIEMKEVPWPSHLVNWVDGKTACERRGALSRAWCWLFSAEVSAGPARLHRPVLVHFNFQRNATISPLHHKLVLIVCEKAQFELNSHLFKSMKFWERWFLFPLGMYFQIINYPGSKRGDLLKNTTQSDVKLYWWIEEVWRQPLREAS